MTRIEVIVNNKSSKASLAYVNLTTFSVPLPDKDNYGELNIGAGNSYLMFMYDYFDKIYGYSQCDYTHYTDPSNPRKCLPCGSGKYSLDT